MRVTKLGILADVLATAQRKLGRELNFISNSKDIYTIIDGELRRISPVYKQAVESLGIKNAVTLRHYMSQNKDLVLAEEHGKDLKIIVPEFREKREVHKRYIPTEEDIEFINNFVKDPSVLYKDIDKTIFEEDIKENGWNENNVWVGRNPDEDIPPIFIHIPDKINPDVAQKIFAALQKKGFDKYIYNEFLKNELANDSNIFKVSFIRYNTWVNNDRPERIIDNRRYNRGNPKDLLKNRRTYQDVMHESTVASHKRITVINESTEDRTSLIYNIWASVHNITYQDLDLTQYYAEMGIDPIMVESEDFSDGPMLHEVTSIIANDDHTVTVCLGDTIGVCLDIEELSDNELHLIYDIVGVISDEIDLHNAEVYTLEDVDESMRNWNVNTKKLNENKVPFGIIDFADSDLISDICSDIFDQYNYRNGSVTTASIDITTEIYSENVDEDVHPLTLTYEDSVKKVERWRDEDDMGRHSDWYYDIDWYPESKAVIKITDKNGIPVPFVNEEYLIDKVREKFDDEFLEIKDYDD